MKNSIHIVKPGISSPAFLSRLVLTGRVRTLIFILAAYLLIPSVPSAGQDATEPVNQGIDRKHVSLFDSDDLLNVSVYVDLRTFLKEVDKSQSLDALLTMHFSESDSLQSKVELSYRGQSRLERCKFPPTRITFKKALFEDPDTGRIKKMKLVNQCQSGYNYEEYVIREYLVYKLYEVLTDTCYRTRLLKVSYIDTENKRRPLEQYGIFLEPDGMVEERLNIQEAKTGSVRQSHMFPAMIDRIAVFNYMISNWDWAVVSRHNIKVFIPTSYSGPMMGIPVPFDFDLTGVVNAEYAIPVPDSGIETCRDRLFLGICRDRETYKKTLLMFLDKREEFQAVVNDFPYLDKAAKRDVIWYLDTFFNQLENEKSLENMIDTFLETCKDS